MPDKKPEEPLPQVESELISQLEQGVVGFLIFVARILRTLVLVGFRPSRVRQTHPSAIGVSSPYTFLALGGMLATRALRAFFLIFALVMASFDACGRADTQLDEQLPTLIELVTLPTMLEFLLVAVPLVGLAVGLALAFGWALSTPPAETRPAILPAACYALGFQFVLAGLLLIPVVVAMTSSYNFSEDAWSYAFLAAAVVIVVWPAGAFARLVLLGVPTHNWRLKRRVVRVIVVTLTSVILSVIMAAGGVLLSRPFHLEDVRQNHDKFPRAVLVSQVLSRQVDHGEWKLTLFVTNDARGPLVLTGSAITVDVGNNIFSGQIVGTDVPLTFERGQAMTIGITAGPLIIPPEELDERMQQRFVIKFTGAYQNHDGSEADRKLTTGTITTAPTW